MQESTIATLDFSAATSFERARNCFHDEKFSEAAGLLSLVLLSDPGHAAAYTLRAEAYFRLEEYQKAYDDAARALELRPDDPVALFRRGTVLAMHGHLEPALADLDRLLETQKDHIEGLLRRFWVLARLGRQQAADEDLRTVLCLIPDETPGQFMAVHFCLQGGRLEAARTLLSSILTREPENVEALKYRGLVWRHMGVPDMAVSDLSYAVDAQEAAGGAFEILAELLVERAVALVEMGKRTLTKRAYKQALADLTRVLDEGAGKLARPAIVLYQRALAWTLLADRCWLDKSGYQKAIDDDTAALSADPDFVDARQHRATLYWKAGRCDDVIEDCTKIIALAPDHADALHLRAEAYLKRSEPEKAEADFQAIDRIHATQAEAQQQAIQANRQACDQLDCSRFC